MTSERIIIVGAGVMGLGVGWRCARAGREVLLLDAEKAGSQASSAAAGMLAPYAEVEFHETALLRLGEAGQRLWPELIGELQELTGVDIEYDRSGSMIVAVDRDEAELLQRLCRYQKEHGLSVEWLSGDALRAREPMLSPQLPGGIDCPGDHQLNPVRLVEALRRAATDAGAQIRENARVDSIEIDGDRVRAVTLESGEPLPAGVVVIAAGAWSRQLRGLGRMTPPVRPVKGQIASVQADAANPPLRHTIRSPRGYLAPKKDGSIIVGASSDERGFNRDLFMGAYYEMFRRAWEVLPITYELKINDMWCNFRPGSRDNAPLLGACEVAGLHFATGHYRNGIQLSGITALTVAEGILTGRTPELIAAFGCGRFSTAAV